MYLLSDFDLPSKGRKTVSAGAYQLRATVHAEPDLGGAALQTLAVAFTVVAAPVSTDATLRSLTLDGVTLAPSFGGTTERYTASVGHGMTSVTVETTPTRRKRHGRLPPGRGRRPRRAGPPGRARGRRHRDHGDGDRRGPKDDEDLHGDGDPGGRAGGGGVLRAGGVQRGGGLGGGGGDGEAERRTRTGGDGRADRFGRRRRHGPRLVPCPGERDLLLRRDFAANLYRGGRSATQSPGLAALSSDCGRRRCATPSPAIIGIGRSMD